MSRPHKVIPLAPLSSRSVTHLPYKSPPPEFAQPTTITNATSKEPYTGTAWKLRPGAEDHKRYLSRGIG